MPDRSVYVSRFAQRDAADVPAWWFRGDLAAGDAPGDPPEGDPPAADPPAPPAADPPAGDPPADADESRLPEGARLALAKARQDARDAQKAARDSKKRADDLEEAERLRAAAELSELDREKARADAAEAAAAASAATARATAVRYAVAIEAGKQNLHDAETAYALLDQGAVEFGPDGAPTNVAALVTALVAEKPFLVKPKGALNVDPSPEGDDKPPSREEIEKLARGRIDRPRSL